MEVLLGKNPHLFKANLHCHTTNSDGRMTPEMVKEEYKSRGYSVVAFTDHEHVVDNSHLTDGEFLAINGCEIAIKEEPTQSTMVKTDMRVVHLNFYAKRQGSCDTPCYNSVYDHFLKDEIRDRVSFSGEYERVYSHEGISEIIAEASRQGFLVSYNHPTWSLEDARHYLGYDGLFAVEIYNHGAVVNGLPDDEVVIDQMRRAGKRVFLTACDDNHNWARLDSPLSDSFGGFVMIDAEELSYQSIIEALERGDFYASCGPLIYSVTREGMCVTVKCSGARKISLISETRFSESAFAPEGEEIYEVSFILNKKNGAYRIKVTDIEGKRAFTQYFEL